MGVEQRLAEQVAYYRARAPEYDEWWERRGAYDLGNAFAQAWQRDIDEVRAWLDTWAPLGDVLELAAGTGNWTAELAARSRFVTAVDASPEALAINAAKLDARPGAPVERVPADLFAWEPSRRYDTVFFGFWMSHVPAARWDAFWSLVESALVPGGVVLFCDNARREHAHASWPVASVPPQPFPPPGAAPEQEVRTLNDGTSFEIVKRYWTPPQLTAELAERGWTASVHESTFAFIYGSARRG